MYDTNDPKVFYRVGDIVERFITWGNNRKEWEAGYTVIAPPEENVVLTGYIYISKPHTRGFKEYIVGVPPEHIRHSLANNPQID